jgi:hypothetical protein
MGLEVADGHRVFLSTLPAGPGERRLALTVVLVSAVIFLVTVPFARFPLAPVVGFIPMYQSALAINDLITAVLLFGQFIFLRSRAMWVLASGYLFTAVIAVSHMLTFPGLFSPTGLLGAGPQSTAWLYMFWHGGFPLFVIAYALLKDSGREMSPARHPRVAVLGSVGAMLVAVCGLTLVATAGQDALPAIMQGNHYTPTMITVVSSAWGLSLLALVMLWWGRPHAVLDLWLMVAMSSWLFDIALAAVLNAGRFDVGFYAGRIYGLLAASFVLIALLVENGKLYFELDRQNRSLEETVRERTERLLQSEKVATMGSLLAGVAHELNNPLAVVTGHAQLLRDTVSDPGVVRRAEKIDDAAGRCVRIVRNFLALARRQAPERGEVQLNDVVQQAVELLAYELRTGNVEVSLGLAEDLPVLWADGHQLHQVLVNIVANAHHAPQQLAPAAHHHHRAGSHGPAGPPRDRRHRARDSGRDSGQDLRAFLHHEAARRGDGPGAVALPGYRRGAWRHHRGGERARAGYDVPDQTARGSAAHRRGRAGHRGGAGGGGPEDHSHRRRRARDRRDLGRGARERRLPHRDG